MGVSRLLNSWAMTAEMVPMVARRCDSVSWVRSDSSCCCNCASRSVSESASAVEVVGVVLTKECTPVNCYRQLPPGGFRRQKRVEKKPSGYSHPALIDCEAAQISGRDRHHLCRLRTWRGVSEVAGKPARGWWEPGLRWEGSAAG